MVEYPDILVILFKYHKKVHSMKNILLLLTVLIATLNANPKAPKMGCILAQQGKVQVGWTLYGDTKLGIEDNCTEVEFIPIQKKGKNFHEILVGSRIKADFQGKPLVAKFLHIQSKKRIARGPRRGLILFSIILNDIHKDIPMSYFYEKGDMRMKGYINLKDFNLSKKDIYTELVFDVHIHSIVCAVPHNNTKARWK